MKKILILLFVSYTFTVQSQSIDQAKSYIRFEINNMLLGSVDGTIKGMSGTFDFNQNNLASSKFDVTIRPETIDTRNEKRDEHLRNEDFFHVEKYETIRFTSKEIQKDGSNFVAIGNLTVLGVTNEVKIPFTITQFEGKNKFEGEIEVNRFDYGLGTEAYSGTIMVGKRAKIKIVCVSQ